MTKKQKMISTGALTLLVAAALIANFTAAEYSAGKGQVQEVSAQGEAQITETDLQAGELSFVAQYKDQRQLTRQEETRHLETILKDEKTDDNTRRAAHEQLIELAERTEKELAIETLLEAKGFEKVAVAVQSEIINIMVQGEELEDSEVAQILEIAMSQGKVGAENVKIIPTVQSQGKN